MRVFIMRVFTMRVFIMRGLAGAALFVTIALVSGTVFACGDKLLAVGRGLRFQRANAAREANLVIYADGARTGTSLGGNKLQAALRRAVHQMQVVQDTSQLGQTLQSGRVDVVLVEFVDLAAVTQQLKSAPSKPAIVPILVKPSKAEFAAAQKDYRFALRATADDLEYLAAIDEAMKLRLKSRS
jgi:ABC-type amino acid transport substrate-binding protein